jgi:hypothetical protein
VDRPTPSATFYPAEALIALKTVAIIFAQSVIAMLSQDQREH